MPHGLRTTFSLLPRHAHVSSSFVGYWATLVGLTPRVSLLPAPLAGPARAQAATSRGAARTILQRNSAPSVAGHRPADESEGTAQSSEPPSCLQRGSIAPMLEEQHRVQRPEQGAHPTRRHALDAGASHRASVLTASVDSARSDHEDSSSIMSPLSVMLQVPRSEMMQQSHSPFRQSPHSGSEIAFRTANRRC